MKITRKRCATSGWQHCFPKPRQPSRVTHNIIQPFVNATNIVMVLCWIRSLSDIPETFYISKASPRNQWNCPIW